MKSTVKIGLVGASWFADLWYLPVLQKHPQVELTAICSKSGESAKQMAEKYQISRVYTDYHEMLKTEKDLDGICIITPNDSHKDITLAAIERNLHVICEKPLAMDAKEAQAMATAANQQKIISAVNFTYREHPAIQRLKALVEEGFVGTIHEARLEYSGDYGLKSSPGWRGTISKGGIGGILQDLGSHLIDLTQLILNQKIVQVTGTLSFYENGQFKEIHEKETTDQAADSTTFIAKGEHGTVATLFTSWVSPQGNNGQTIEILLNGSKGSLHLFTSELGTSLRYGLAGEQWKEIQVENVPPLDWGTEPSEHRFRPWRVTDKNEAWKWVDHILGKENGQLATFDQGYQVQKVIDAVIQSATEQKTIRVD